MDCSIYLLGQGTRRPICSDIEIFEASPVPPQTTRAKLRGDFIKRAQEKRRDFTVDWVHLKLNDQARTVLVGPFKSVDERVGGSSPPCDPSIRGSRHWGEGHAEITAGHAVAHSSSCWWDGSAPPLNPRPSASARL